MAEATRRAGSLSLADAEATLLAGSLAAAAASVIPSETIVLRRAPRPASIPPVARSRPATSSSSSIAAAGLAVALAGTLVASVPQVLVHRDRTWVAPMVLSKSDPRVREVAAALEEARHERMGLEQEKERLASRLHDLDATDGAPDLEAAMRAELVQRRAEERRLQKVVDDRDAQLIPPSTDLNARLKATSQRVRALDAALAGLRTRAALALRHEYEDARRASDDHQAERSDLTQRLADADAALAANAAHLRAVEALPHRIAADEDAVIAFVPEENLAHVRAGAALFACRWGTFACSRTGEVLEVLDGEIAGPDPIAGERTRGRFVRVTPPAANRRLLFVR